MGWRKTLAHATGGAIQMGNWVARYNQYDDSLDTERNSNGIPYIRLDNAFAAGVHDYTEVGVSGLQLQQFPGWSESVSNDEAAAFDEDATLWDDAGTGTAPFATLLNAAATDMAYEGVGVFIATAVNLAPVQRFNSSNIAWAIAAEPLASSITVQSRVYKQGTWAAWSSEVSDTTINDMPAAATNLASDLYMMQYRALLGANAGGETPVIQEVEMLVYSRKHFRIMSDGEKRLSQYMWDSIGALPGPTEEVLVPIS